MVLARLTCAAGLLLPAAMLASGGLPASCPDLDMSSPP